MKCSKCGADMNGASCMMCKGPMECNGECSCKACNRSVKKEEMVCDACLAKQPM